MFPGLGPEQLERMKALASNPGFRARMEAAGKQALGFRPEDNPTEAEMEARMAQKMPPGLMAAMRAARAAASASGPAAPPSAPADSEAEDRPKPLDVSELTKYKPHEMTADSPELSDWIAALQAVADSTDSEGEFCGCYAHGMTQANRRLLRHHLGCALAIHTDEENDQTFPGLFEHAVLGDLLVKLGQKGQTDQLEYLAREGAEAALESGAAGKEPVDHSADDDKTAKAESPEEEEYEDEEEEREAGSGGRPADAPVLPVRGGMAREAVLKAFGGLADDRAGSRSGEGLQERAAAALKARQTGAAAGGAPASGQAEVLQGLLAMQAGGSEGRAAAIDCARRAGASSCGRKVMLELCCGITVIFAAGAAFGAWLNSGSASAVCPAGNSFQAQGVFQGAHGPEDEFDFGPEWE